jgi:fumarate reductase subunit C
VKRLELWLYIAQRGSALVLAPLVFLHLGVILYAVAGGLSAAEILGRTRASPIWPAIYGLFVVAASVHAAIGVRIVIREWTAWRDRSLDVAMVGLGLVLLLLGLRAVQAIA